MDPDAPKVDKYASQYSDKIKVSIKTKKQAFQFFPSKTAIMTVWYCNNDNDSQPI